MFLTVLCVIHMISISNNLAIILIINTYIAHTVCKACSKHFTHINPFNAHSPLRKWTNKRKTVKYITHGHSGKRCQSSDSNSGWLATEAVMEQLSYCASIKGI